MADHLLRLGRSLESASDSYNSAIGSLESRVLVSARRFTELGATSQEAEIVELRSIEGGVRKLQVVETTEPATTNGSEASGSESA